MASKNEYVKYGRREFRDKVDFTDEFKKYEDYECIAGYNDCDDGSDEWFLIKPENEDDYIVLTFDMHLFSDNELHEKHFDDLLEACNYIRDELDRDFSLGDAETGAAIVGLLDAIFGDKD